MDGWLRIYAGETGEVLWELDSMQDFDTVSGEKARGGKKADDSACAVHGCAPFRAALREPAPGVMVARRRRAAAVDRSTRGPAGRPYALDSA